jgi:hypothetical protein
MGKTTYIGVEGVSRAVKAGYIGIAGVARCFTPDASDLKMTKVGEGTTNTNSWVSNNSYNTSGIYLSTVNKTNFTPELDKPYFIVDRTDNSRIGIALYRYSPYSSEPYSCAYRFFGTSPYYFYKYDYYAIVD